MDDDRGVHLHGVLSRRRKLPAEVRGEMGLTCPVLVVDDHIDTWY